MGGRGGSAVGVVVVAPGTSSYVGRVLGNCGVEGRRNYVHFFRLQKLNRKIAYCCIRRCSLVLSASSAVSSFLLLLLLLLLLVVVVVLLASATGASAAAAAAAAPAATALRTAGWSCSVFYSLFSFGKAIWWRMSL